MFSRVAEGVDPYQDAKRKRDAEDVVPYKVR